MKLKWFDRFLIVLSALVLILIALGALGVGLGMLRVPFIDFFNLMVGYWVNVVILSAICVLILAVAVRMIVAVSAHPVQVAPQNVLLKTTENGTIRLSLTAVDVMVQRSVRGNSAVRDVSTRLLVTPQETLAIQLRLTLAPDTIVSDLSAQLQSDVRDYVQGHAGVPVQEIAIFVDASPAVSAARVE